MEFNELIYKRYSCKKYSDRKVEDEVLTNILKGGQAAPTAKNSQPQHIYVLKSEEALKMVDAVSPCRYNAPVVLAVTYDKNNQYTYPGGKYVSGIEDATIVATHLLLAAANEGVDSCWLNCFEPDQLKELLKLPENEEIVMLLDLGYGVPEFKPLENHTKRKSLEETVTYR